KEHRSKDRPLHETQDGSTRKGSRDGMFLELLDVALFDLAHELFAAEEIIAEMAGELARDNEELVVGDFAEGNGAARGHEMGAPLNHEAEIPEDEAEEKRGGGQRGRLERGEIVGEALNQDGEADDEENSERDEEPI